MLPKKRRVSNEHESSFPIHFLRPNAGKLNSLCQNLRGGCKFVPENLNCDIRILGGRTRITLRR